MNKLILERKEKEVFMEVRIQSIHFDASDKLEAFIQKKAEKLEKFCSEFYAEKISDTFEESIDVCMEALSKQLLKAKEKLQGK